MSSNVKILVGDDSNDFGKIFAGAIQDAGYSVTTCRNDGSDVLNSIRENQPDIVLCDALMPGADAMEIIRRIDLTACQKPFFIVGCSYRNAYM